MSDKTKLRLNRPLFIVMVIVLSTLTACSAVEGLGLIGGEEQPPPVEEATEAVEQATSTPAPPTPTTKPTATTAFGAGEPEETAAADAEATASGTPEGTQTAEEPTPTRIATMEGTPGDEEATPEATSDAEATSEASDTPETPTTPGTVVYTVQSGDTLGEIAKNFGTTISEIVSLNETTYPSLKTSPDDIEVGWMLTVPSTWSGTLYTVQQADVLEEIAKQHETTVEAIVSLNEETYPSLRTEPWKLEIGWVLKIP